MTGSDEQQIRDLVGHLDVGHESRDVDIVLSLMTDDVVFLVAGQAPFGKQKFAEAMRSPAVPSCRRSKGAATSRRFAWPATGPSCGRSSRSSSHRRAVVRRSACRPYTVGAAQVRRAGGSWRADANLLIPVNT
jgi:hypothetical protein